MYTVWVNVNHMQLSKGCQAWGMSVSPTHGKFQQSQNQSHGHADPQGGSDHGNG
jgi:hypothetical protein